MATQRVKNLPWQYLRRAKTVLSHQLISSFIHLSNGKCLCYGKLNYLELRYSTFWNWERWLVSRLLPPFVNHSASLEHPPRPSARPWAIPCSLLLSARTVFASATAWGRSCVEEVTQQLANELPSRHCYKQRRGHSDCFRVNKRSGDWLSPGLKPIPVKRLCSTAGWYSNGPSHIKRGCTHRDWARLVTKNFRCCAKIARCDQRAEKFGFRNIKHLVEVSWQKFNADWRLILAWVLICY